jgi:hypothetical protein
LKPTLAPTGSVDALEELAREFFEVVLEADRDNYLITDESLLCDVLTEESPAAAEQRLLDRYGVDVEAAPCMKLVDVFERMRAARRITSPQ